MAPVQHWRQTLIVFGKDRRYIFHGRRTGGHGGVEAVEGADAEVPVPGVQPVPGLLEVPAPLQGVEQHAEPVDVYTA